MDLSYLSDGPDDYSQRDEWSGDDESIWYSPAITLEPTGDAASLLVFSGREPTAQDIADDIEYERTEGAATQRAWEGNVEQVDDIPDDVLFPHGVRRSGAPRGRHGSPPALSDVDVARTALEQAQRQLAEAQARAEKYGPEPEIGTAITFLHFYGDSRKPYTFAALRTEPGWFVTGKETGWFTWVELHQELIYPGTLRVATGWDADLAKAVATTVSQLHGSAGALEMALAGPAGPRTIEYYACVADGDVHEVVKMDGRIVSDRATSTTTSYVRALKRADEMNAELRAHLESMFPPPATQQDASTE